MRNSYIQSKTHGILLFVKLTPNAREDEVLGTIDGIDGPLIAARVRAIPDKGKANKAIINLLAKWLGLAKSDITLKSGSKSRLKTLAISGQTDELQKAVEQALAQDRTTP